jgi:hypothetical protein
MPPVAPVLLDAAVELVEVGRLLTGGFGRADDQKSVERVDDRLVHADDLLQVQRRDVMAIVAHGPPEFPKG